MQKVSKTDLKLIKSLKYKKYRYKYGLFVAEGPKLIKEFLNSRFELVKLYSVAEGFRVDEAKTNIISSEALKALSFLTTPQTAIAVFKLRQDANLTLEGLTLALDGVNDPGNLGTIIRLCDWFDVKNLLCSKATVDCYNPKVVQSTMGSLSRVKIHYVDLGEVLNGSDLFTYSSETVGESVYDTKLTQNAILVMGNESHGVSEDISSLISKKLTIPPFGLSQDAESLNVAMATSIMLSEFKRRTIER